MERICERCKVPMRYSGRERLVGRVGGIVPDVQLGGRIVEVYICPKCRRLEFVQPAEQATSEGLPQKTCPHCGGWHDFDYPQCPYCGFDYYR